MATTYTTRFQNEYDQLWDLLVPSVGDADSTQGELIRAIGRLRGEYFRNGNMNWSFSGPQMYQDWVSHVWGCLVPDDEEEANGNSDNEFVNPFDEATIKQIKQDLGFIELFGMLNTLHYEKEQAERVLEAALPNESVYTPYDRVADRVVEWCFANPVLKGKANDESVTSLESVLSNIPILQAATTFEIKDITAPSASELFDKLLVLRNEEQENQRFFPTYLTAADFSTAAYHLATQKDERAIALCDEALSRVEPRLLQWQSLNELRVATYTLSSLLLNKGWALFNLNRLGEAVEMNQEVLRRCTDSENQLVLRNVIRALGNNAEFCCQLGRIEDGLNYGNVLSTAFFDATDAEVQFGVVKALTDFADKLVELQRRDEADIFYKKALDLFPTVTDDQIEAVKQRAKNAIGL